MTYYLEIDDRIIAVADHKFHPDAIETVRNIVRGSDGGLYFDDELPEGVTILDEDQDRYYCNPAAIDLDSGVDYPVPTYTEQLNLPYDCYIYVECTAPNLSLPRTILYASTEPNGDVYVEIMKVADDRYGIVTLGNMTPILLKDTNVYFGNGAIVSTFKLYRAIG